MLDLDITKKVIGVITAGIAAVGGGYTLWDDIFPSDNPILTWAPEYFEVYGGPANGTFSVIVAREKHRDDCSVEAFTLEMKDSEYTVFYLIPSVTNFSGPATDKIDKFGFKFHLEENDASVVALGTATLLGEIKYECPGGTVFIHYPDNLTFEITEPLKED